MGGSLPLAYYNALQEERGEPGPGAGAECVTSEPVPRVVTTRLYGWCLPRRMEGCQENKVLLNFSFLVMLSTFFRLCCPLWFYKQLKTSHGTKAA